MPYSGYLLPENSLLWTKRGLLFASELDENDEIFGVQNNIGNWTKIDYKSELERKFDAYKLCVNSIELLLLENSKISTLTGFQDVKTLSKNEKIYICNKNQIFEDVYKELKDNRSVMNYNYKGNSYKLIIGPILSYLIGRYIFYDFNSSYFKIKMKFHADEEVEGIYYKIRSIFNPIKNEIRIFINWKTKTIIFESVYLENIIKNILSTNNIPIEVRTTSMNSIQSFFLGMLENDQCKYFKIDKRYIIIITKNTEENIRNIIFSYLNIFGLIPTEIKYKNYETQIYINRYNFSEVINKRTLFNNKVKLYKTFEETYQTILKKLHYKIKKIIIIKLPDELINFNLINGAILMKPMNINKYV